MKRGKVIICALAILALISSVFAGCLKQADEGNAEVTVAEEENQSVEAVEEEPAKESYKMVLDLHTMMDSPDVMIALEEIQKLDKFSHIEFEILEKSTDYEQKMPIAIASGQQRDIVAVTNPIQQALLANAGTIVPLDQYIDELGVDFDATFGKYSELSKQLDGQITQIPYGPTSWAMFYNKKIFDDANIPYPDPQEPMTWEEYRELAKQLTSGEGNDRIYGALQIEWPMYWYGEAIQILGGGEHFYNAEGLSNIEDPAFSKALKRTYEMMHEDKSIPTYADIIVSKTDCTSFFNGKYGLYIHGVWLLNWAVDKGQYPRDWEIGLAPMPVDDASEGRKTWGACGGFVIAATSVNPKEATEVALELNKIGCKHVKAAPPTNQTVEPEALFVEVGEALASEGLDKEAIIDAFTNPEIAFLTEKVSGPNAANYEQVINEEVEKYFVQEQDLETTIANIKERGDEAIQDN